jgi:hypothetical protein
LLFRTFVKPLKAPGNGWKGGAEKIPGSVTEGLNPCPDPTAKVYI